MDASKKLDVRKKIGQNVQQLDSLSEIKNTLHEDILKIGPAYEIYVEAKFTKYCLENAYPHIKAEIERESVDFSDIRQFLSDLNYPDKLFHQPSKLLVSSPYSNLLFSAGKEYNLERKKYACSILKDLLQQDIINKLESLKAKLKSAESIGDFERFLCRYITGYKTQFVIPSSASSLDIIQGKVTETTDLDWEQLKQKKYFAEQLNEISSLHDEILENLSKERRDAANFDVKYWSKVIAAVRRPASLETKRENDSAILIINQPLLVLSKTKGLIETELKNNKTITEIHFIAERKFFIDSLLSNSVWRGKNILIISDCIECVLDNISWQIGGRNGKVFVAKTANHGVIPGENGCDGENGEEGESGGNVVMIAETFIGLRKLSIRTNGGNGEDGQNGGNGKDGASGVNGRSMELKYLQKNFPSPVGITGCYGGNLKAIIKHLKAHSSNYETHCNGFTEDGEQSGSRLAQKLHMYCRGKFRQEKFEYEFCFSEWGAGRSAYILFKGETGTPAGEGGKAGSGGLGGTGGYAGTVQLFYPNKQEYTEELPHIVKRAGKRGENGSHGKDAFPGVNGVDGHDVGFTHESPWIYPDYYSGGYFKLINKSAWKRAWCNKNKTYRRIDKFEPIEDIKRVIDTERSANQRHEKIALKKSAINTGKAFQLATQCLNSTLVTPAGVEGEINRWKDMSIGLHGKHNFERTAFLNGYIFREAPTFQPSITNPDEGLQNGIVRDPTDAHAPLHNIIPCSSLKESEMSVQQKLISECMSIWQPGLIKVEAEKGPESFLHAVFGSKNENGTLALASNNAYQLRVEILTELFKSLRTSGEYSKKMQPYLELTFQKFHHHQTQLNRQQLEDYLLRFPQQQVKDLLNGTNHHVIISIVMLNAIQDILCRKEITLQQHELHLLACFRDKDFIVRDSTSEIIFDPNLVKQQQQNENLLILGIDNEGNYFKYELVSARNWKTFQNSIDQYFAPENTEGTAQVSSATKIKIQEAIYKMLSPGELTSAKWPRNYLKLFCSLTFLKSNELSKHLMNERCFKMMFQEMSTTFKSDLNCLPLFYIMLKYNPSHWPREVCIFLLEKNSKTEHLSKELEDKYRASLSPFPSIILYHLITHIKNNSKIYENEFVNNELRKELHSLEKYGPFDSQEDYKELQYSFSVSQWHQQFNKIKLMTRFKSHLSNVDFQKACNNFSEAFYYYYSIIENCTKLDELLCVYNEKRLVQSELNNQKHSLSKILSKFHSGRWIVNEETITILQSSDTIAEFFIRMDNHTAHVTKQTLSSIMTALEHDPMNTFDKQQLSHLTRLAENNISCEDIVNWPRIFKEKISTNQEPLDYNALISEALAKIEEEIRNVFRHTLHEPQRLAILSAAVSVIPDSHYSHSNVSSESTETKCRKNNSLLLQVKTGEGKSYIVLAAAIIRGLFGMKTDVVTSSSVLAQRDAIKFERIYNAFEISVGHNTMDDAEQRTEEYKKTVVYGEACQFQRDYLVDHFYGQNVRGDRKFENIIIDEVDSMFLDKGNNVLYLSHSPAILEALEPILLCIWQSTLQMLNNDTYEPMQIHETVMAITFPTLTKEVLANFGDDADGVWNVLQDLEVINEKGTINTAKLDSLDKESSEFLRHKDWLVSSAQIHHEISMHAKIQHVPKSLQNYIELHLFTWIQSAFQATQMVENVQYVLHTDQFNADRDKHENVLILDVDTGNDLKESQWGNGLHQFLQLKHGCKLTTASLKSVFVSNITFFKFYDNMFGLTGTLGSGADRHFLEATYNSKFLVIPTNLPSKFIEEEPWAGGGRTAWKKKIYQDVSEKMNDGRSVLIISEHISDANEIYDHIRAETRQHNIVLYRRNVENCDVATSKKELESGTIIISTNLAGRGTDIRLASALKESGGLHVIMAYLPTSSRVRWQGMGRAARCGDKGSGRLIFCTDDEDIPSSLDTAIDYISQKDTEENVRVSKLHSHYNNVVKFEEEKFAEFKECFDDLCYNLDAANQSLIPTPFTGSETKLKSLVQGNLESVKDVVKKSMLDNWAFWLDKYSAHLTITKKRSNNSTIEHEIFAKEQAELQEEFDHLCTQYAKVGTTYQSTESLAHFAYLVGAGESETMNYSTSLISDPSLAVKIAVTYLKYSDHVKAQHILDRILAAENENSLPFVIVKYYKILAMLQAKDFKGASREIPNVCDMLSKHISQQMEISRTVAANEYILDQKIVIRNGLSAQKHAKTNILSAFLNSLESINGKADVQPHDFFDLVDGDVAEATMLHEMLLRDNWLLCQRLSDTLDEDGRLAACHQLACAAQVDHKTLLDNINHFSIADHDGGNEFYEEAKRKIKNGLSMPSSKGFLKEIKDAVQVKVQDFVLITKSRMDTDENSVNEYNEWLHSQKTSHPEAIFLTTSEISLSDFEGIILKRDKVNFRKDFKASTLYYGRQKWFEKVVGIDATILLTIKLKNFTSITFNDFQNTPGVSDELSERLFTEFQQTGVLDENGILQTVDIYETYKNNKNDLTDSVFDLLGAEIQNCIVNTIHSKCCYQLEKLRIIKQSEQNTGTCTSIQLVRNPLDKLLSDAQNLLLIDGIRVNPSKISNNGMAESLHEKLEQIGEYFSKSEKIDLACLADIFPDFTNENLRKVQNMLISHHIVDTSGQILIDMDNLLLDKIDIQARHLISKIKSYSTLRTRLKKSQFKRILKSRLHDLCGISTLEDCEFLPIKLSPHIIPQLAKNVDFILEQERLSLVGLGYIITTSHCHTAKMRINALSVIVLGMTQIAIGTVLLVPSMGYGSIFVGTGANDIIYGFRALHSGTFAWRKWALSKTLNIAALLATFGVAKYIPSNVKSVLPRLATVNSTMSTTRDVLGSVGRHILSILSCELVCNTIAANMPSIVSTIVKMLSQLLVSGVRNKIKSNKEYSNVLHTIVVKFDDGQAHELFQECSSEASCILSEESELFKMLFKLLKFGIDKGVPKLCNKLESKMGENYDSNLNDLIPWLMSEIVSWAEMTQEIGQIIQKTDKYINRMEEGLIAKIGPDYRHEKEMTQSAQDQVERFQELTVTNIQEAIEGIISSRITTELLERGMQEISKFSQKTRQEFEKSHQVTGEQVPMQRRRNKNMVKLHMAESEMNSRRSQGHVKKKRRKNRRNNVNRANPVQL